MDWLNHYAPAIQAITAAGIFALTCALVWATLRYVRATDRAVKLARERAEREGRVEVYLRFYTQPVTLTSRHGFVEIANLAAVGIWVEKIVAMAVQPKAGPPVETTVQRIVPAFATYNSDCTTLIYQAFSALGENRSQYLGSVEFRVSYRVHGEWREERLTSPPLISDQSSIFIEDPA